MLEVAERKEVLDFKGKYKKFLESLPAIVAERNKRKAWDADMEMIYWRFNKVVVTPMDEAWQKLTKVEKDKFFSKK